MKVNRRGFLQGAAAIAAAGTFGSNAWAEDPIAVAGSTISRAGSTSTASRWSMR